MEQDLDFLIGVDGGGTGTRAVVLDARSQRMVGQGEAGASALTQGVEQAWKHVMQAIAAALEGSGRMLRPEHCAIGLGLAAVNVPSLTQGFLAQAPAFARLALDTDGYAMLLGAHEGRPGMVVAAGTGSVGVALMPDGERRTSGGWGFPVGDEGSGARLGLEAMRHAQWALDGRAPVGALAQAVYARIGRDAQTLVSWSNQANARLWAQLAPLVFENQHQDPAAQQLLQKAADQLAQLAEALDPQGELPLVFNGSIGQRLQSLQPDHLLGRCRTPYGDATHGALLLLKDPAALKRSRV